MAILQESPIISPIQYVKSFRALAAKFTKLKINPIAPLTPPSAKERGNLILPILQKCLIIRGRTYVEIFMMLALILKISSMSD